MTDPSGSFLKEASHAAALLKVKCVSLCKNPQFVSYILTQFSPSQILLVPKHLEDNTS